MKYISKIQKNADISFERFKSKQLTYSKETIFQNAGEIRFFIEIKEYIADDSNLEKIQKEHLKKLSELGVNTIDILYDYYIKSEYASIETWGAIDQMLLNFFARG